METREHRIITSWHENADAWTQTVRADAIESRRVATNAAIIEAVMQYSPETVLDAGCGEGWLSRALAMQGVCVTGIDSTPELVEQARQAELARSEDFPHFPPHYELCSYEDLSTRFPPRTFDAMVCNFSLIGKESTEACLQAASWLLKPNGLLFIQTLHPVEARGDGSYEEGWREGSWTGFGEAFRNPATWYFRPLGAWVALVNRSGFRLVELIEPMHPHTHKLLSVILIARVT